MPLTPQMRGQPVSVLATMRGEQRIKWTKLRTRSHAEAKHESLVTRSTALADANERQRMRSAITSAERSDTVSRGLRPKTKSVTQSVCREEDQHAVECKTTTSALASKPSTLRLKTALIQSKAHNSLVLVAQNRDLRGPRTIRCVGKRTASFIGWMVL